MKVAFITMFSTITVKELTEQMVIALLNSSPSLMIALGHKLIRFSRQVQKILESPGTKGIKELLLNKNMSNEDKVELIRIKIISTLRTLKGSKCKYFILAVISLLIFFFSNKTSGFGFFLANLWIIF